MTCIDIQNYQARKMKQITYLSFKLDNHQIHIRQSRPTSKIQNYYTFIDNGGRCKDDKRVEISVLISPIYSITNQLLKMYKIEKKSSLLM